MLGGMTQLAKSGHDVRFRLPILRLHFPGEILIDGRRTCAVEKDEDFEFLFHGSLFGAFEFAGEKVVHHQRRNESGDPKILLRIVVKHMKSELVTTAREPREELVYLELFLVCPLANRVQ
jgi:hypothetical protein